MKALDRAIALMADEEQMALPGIDPGGVRKIRTSYEVVTYESAEEGDAEERGWEDEEGVVMEPDEFDQEEGITAVDKAVEFLSGKGVIEASSYPWAPGDWFISEDEVDYKTGDRTQYHFFLDNFTPEEEREIARQVLGDRYVRKF